MIVFSVSCLYGRHTPAPKKHQKIPYPRNQTIKVKISINFFNISKLMDISECKVVAINLCDDKFAYSET